MGSICGVTRGLRGMMGESFRGAVRKQFRIFYNAYHSRWFYYTASGRTRARNCAVVGVLDALRLICEDQMRDKETGERGNCSILRARLPKRKFSEGLAPSRDDESSPSSDELRSMRASSGANLRGEVSRLKCSLAGLRKLAEQRQERIDELEAAAWARPAVADGADGRERAARVEAGEVAALTAEVGEWKKKFEEEMELRDEDRQAAAEELELAREVNSMRESAMRGELKALREETAGLKKAFADAHSEINRWMTADRRIRKIERTCEATLNSVRYITDWTQGTQVMKMMQVVPVLLRKE
ncbi:hypothetical protein FOZ60_004221 [Perkinsus olseni]|nr:hypothetical protein FOZ60_004221 [Perkinsus olseni]KAF4716827.1 hypothetical protein FOZ62_026294 [Perkinsus olseni]